VKLIPERDNKGYTNELTTPPSKTYHRLPAFGCKSHLQTPHRRANPQDERLHKQPPGSPISSLQRNPHVPRSRGKI